jgi:two-component system CheB/CheR fusion protein
VITPDVLAEPRWKDWTALASDYGYRGCWSFPVETSAGTLVGSLAMYWEAPHAPTAAELDVAATLTQNAAVIVSRERLRLECS